MLTPLNAALGYAEKGWSVFPLHVPISGACSCGRADCGSAGKHPRTQHGLKDATLDATVVRQLWLQYPNSNVGVAVPDGFVVLDIDGPDGEAALAAAGIDLPATVEAKTGRGRHLWFRTTVVVGPAVAILPHVDLRGPRSYVVAPPSIHVSGVQYEWITTTSDGVTAEVPAALMRLINGRGNGAAKATDVNATCVKHSIPSGKRNATLTSMAGVMRRRGVSEAAIRVALIKENEDRCDPPLPRADVETIVKSIARYAADESYPQDDAGNGAMFVEQFGDKFRWDRRRRRWLHFCAQRWRPHAEPEALLAAEKLARTRLYAAVDKPEATWAIKSASIRGMQNTITAASNKKPIIDEGDGWDARRDLIVFRNGVFDLQTEALRDGRPEDRMTLWTGVDYVPDAQCPRFEKFLEEVLVNDAGKPDPDLKRYVMRALGMSLTGHTREQVFFIAHGSGANGKSKLLEAVAFAMGDYAGTTASTTFTHVRNRGMASHDLADLDGLRFVIMDEIGGREHLSEARLKAYCHGDVQKVRRLYEMPYGFVPAGKVWMVCNERPKVSDLSLGFWRTVREIPFLAVFEGDRDDQGLIDKLKAERLGILRLLVDYAMEWSREGLGPVPEAIKRNTTDFECSSDGLEDFIEDRCVVDEEASETSSDIAEAYEVWADGKELKSWERLKKRQVGLRMARRFRSARSNAEKRLGGVRLK